MENLNIRILKFCACLGLILGTCTPAAFAEVAPGVKDKFVSVLLGGFYRMDAPGDYAPLFDCGLKIGADIVPTKWGRLAAALSYDLVSDSDGDLNASFSDIHAEAILKRFLNTPFFIAPNLGVAITNRSYAADNLTRFEAGIAAGYEFTILPDFILGPEVRYEHLFNAGSYNALKLAANFTLEF